MYTLIYNLFNMAVIMDKINDMDLSFIFKALGDYNRLKILLKLIDGEKCGNDILKDFYITQPTLSHHMGILRESGLVNVSKIGKKQYYAINRNKLQVIKGFVNLFDIDTQ